MTEIGADLDTERSEFLKRFNVTVIRFENKWVFENLEAVLEEIRSTILRLSKGTTPPNLGGELSRHCDIVAFVAFSARRIVPESTVCPAREITWNDMASPAIMASIKTLSWSNPLSVSAVFPIFLLRSCPLEPTMKYRMFFCGFIRS